MTLCRVQILCLMEGEQSSTPARASFQQPHCPQSLHGWSWGTPGQKGEMSRQRLRGDT